MNGESDTVGGLLDRASAEQYARWFKALSDPTRIQILELLARRREPMSVGAVVAEVGVAQSTVSQHLAVLARVRFVLVEAVGTSRHYRVNEACIECFPTAADVVMGRPAPNPQQPRC
ncbi:metalloregulator ArsR/SmtB family transcription factor [Actinocatenispora sera]|nr:metalloregulator ArsR/SmtB family transcription factor [Actinocatenispora sera]